jgi:perosamine synthetase
MSAVRFPVLEPTIGDLEAEYVLEAVRSGWVSSIGPFVERFEREFAAFCGVPHCVAVANGTVALHLALVAADVGPGDEVLVPDLTFAATAAAVRHAGATPVLVDVRDDDWTIDPDLCERAITPATRAIVPVHLYGMPARMSELRTVCARHRLLLLEDAAEAHGARDESGRRTGALGDAACFSFYGNKLLTTGEGGAITTGDDALAGRARFLKDHAMDRRRRYFHTEVGFNYRLTNLQAALGCAQLARLPDTLERRAQILSWYRAELEPAGIVINPTRPGTSPVCWVSSALLPGTWDADRQARLVAALRDEHGVDTRPFFVPMHQLPPYAACRLVTRGESVSLRLSTAGIGLPTSSRLTREDVAAVAAALREALAR